MSESPAGATPYEVLGVPASADDETIRRAYRRQARLTHPDLGGDAYRFQAVQRAWELIGTRDARRAYDSGAASATRQSPVWRAERAAPRARDSRQSARAYGHPGGYMRERFLAAEREWVGYGDPIPEPYDPALVLRAPHDVRALLAKALAEEATARIVAGLGLGVTVWHDIDAGADGKLDHVVLAPSGLWAIASEDWGARVRVDHGEIISEMLHEDTRPIRGLVRSARTVQRTTRLRFTGRLLVLPDTAINGPVLAGPARRPSAVVMERSALAPFIRGAGAGAVDVFSVRDRLQQTLRLL